MKVWVVASALLFSGTVHATLTVTPTQYPGGDGYQCAFRLKTEKNTESIVFWALPGALLTVNGKQVSLKEQPKKSSRSLERMDLHFAAEKTQARVVATVEGRCPSDHPGCELHTYRATITIAHAGESTTLETIGECGS